MEADFRALIAGDPTLVGLVSTRIYPSTYAQGVAGNAIRYSKISGADELHLQGKDGLNVSVMQLDVRVPVGANDVRTALAIRDALRNRLDAYTGRQGNTDFQLIALRDDRGIKFETTGAETFYTTSLDFDVISRAAA